MTFTMSGHIWDDPTKRPVTVTWTDGELTGDQVAVAKAWEEAAELDGRAIGPVGGPFTESDHMLDPLSAWTVLADWVFAVGAEVTGELPELPDVPDGAII